MVHLEQVFSSAVITPDGRTLYERVRHAKFLLPAVLPYDEGAHGPTGLCRERQGTGGHGMDPYFKDVIDVTAKLAGVISLIVAIVVAIYELRKFTAERRSQLRTIQAQMFLMIMNRAQEIGFSQGMDIIRLFNHQSYDEFMKSRSPDVRNHVRNIVDFLNDIQHLMNHGYINTEHILPIYLVSIKDCKERLLDWWLTGFRQEQGRPEYYENFERLCRMV